METYFETTRNAIYAEIEQAELAGDYTRVDELDVIATRLDKEFVEWLNNEMR